MVCCFVLYALYCRDDTDRHCEWERKRTIIVTIIIRIYSALSNIYRGKRDRMCYNTALCNKPSRG